MPKRLGLLRELVPAMNRVAVLVNPANAARAELQVTEAELGRTSDRLANPNLQGRHKSRDQHRL